MIYLDTSALVKLIADEDRSEALRAAIGSDDALISSALAITELTLAARRHSTAAQEVARLILRDDVSTIPVSDGVLQEAGALEAGPRLMLRSLDAIHVVSARRLGPDVPLITYDFRMADVARSIGLTVLSP